MFNKSKLRLNIIQNHVTPNVCFLRSSLRPLPTKTFQLPSFLLGDVCASSHEAVTYVWPAGVSDGQCPSGQPWATRSLRVNACAGGDTVLHLHVLHVKCHK